MGAEKEDKIAAKKEDRHSAQGNESSAGSRRNGNGSGEAAGASTASEIGEEMRQKIASLRSRVRESFGVVTMAMMMLPRYRHQSLADLQHLVLEPLLQDRIAIAHPRAGEDKKEGELADVAGIAIWASVSEEVDRKIRDQIRAGVFPVRLKPEEWRSGEINWLLDVIAPDQRTITAVIANFRQVLGKGSELRLHPVVGHLLDGEMLKKMGARRMGDDAKADAESGGQQGETPVDPSA